MTSPLCAQRRVAKDLKNTKTKRQSYDAGFKLQVVRAALARPAGQRIKPTCRDYPDIEPVRGRHSMARRPPHTSLMPKPASVPPDSTESPKMSPCHLEPSSPPRKQVQLRKWIRNLSALEHATPTAKCVISSQRHDINSVGASDSSSSSPSPPPHALVSASICNKRLGARAPTEPRVGISAVPHALAPNEQLTPALSVSAPVAPLITKPRPVYAFVPTSTSCAIHTPLQMMGRQEDLPSYWSCSTAPPPFQSAYSPFLTQAQRSPQLPTHIPQPLVIMKVAPPRPQSSSCEQLAALELLNMSSAVH